MKNHIQSYTVESSIPKQSKKLLMISDGKGNRIQTFVQRFAVVGKGDTIGFHSSHSSKIFVLPKDNKDESVKISPHYEANDHIFLGNQKYSIKLKEITTDADLKCYQDLEEFHYKASAVINYEEEMPKKKVTGGRRAIILGYLVLGGRYIPIGYVELQMPLLMVKPRHELFNSPFHHPSRNISWQVWDQHTMRNNVNLIVRIARIVTSPEFRGLGLAKILIKHGKDFARERWQIKGDRPLFIEIMAEMLKHIDFVSSSNIHYAGLTEGNLSRVSKDLYFMQREYKADFGIMSLQKKYLNTLKTSAALIGQKLDYVLNKLKEITENIHELNTLPPEEYFMYKSVLRIPIPYFIGGLDEVSEKYIKSNLKIDKPKPTSIFTVTPSKIDISQLSVRSNIPLPQTNNVRSIMDSFGLVGEYLTSNLLGPINLKATVGNIIFISGPSGSGKSILLKCLDPNYTHKYIKFSFTTNNSSEYSVGWLKNIESDEPIIEYFARKWGMERSIAALNQSGLSEAFIYLKPYSLLSRGQKYRAKLAELALGNDQVWLIDEFCGDLDPLSARIVAKNLKKNVVKYRRIAIVAAANHSHYMDALRPTRIIVLHSNKEPEILTFKVFKNEFLKYNI